MYCVSLLLLLSMLWSMYIDNFVCDPKSHLKRSHRLLMFRKTFSTVSALASFMPSRVQVHNELPCNSLTTFIWRLMALRRSIKQAWTKWRLNCDIQTENFISDELTSQWPNYMHPKIEINMSSNLRKFWFRDWENVSWFQK